MGLSTIQWCDYSWNPWIGCRKVAAECANCYAETLDRNRYSKTLAPGTKENPVSHWGSGLRHRTKTWGDPLKWNKHAKNNLAAFWEWANEQPDDEVLTPPHRPRVFCASLADWLDDENVPIEWFIDLLFLIDETPNLDWLLLTKRPKNWEVRMREAQSAMDTCGGWIDGFPPENVWIGVSAGADQQAALDIPARVHFLSCEPMLKPVDLSLWIGDNPVNEDSILGARTVSSYRSGIGDRQHGTNLENGGPSRNERQQEYEADTMQAEASGEQGVQRLPASKGDGERSQDQRMCPPISVASLQRTDTGRHGCEPQVRNSERQSTEQIGADDSAGKHSARDQSSGKPSMPQSARTKESDVIQKQSASKKWVILGGESGSKSRECNMQWIRDAVETCRRNGVPVFVKQMGSNCVDRLPGRAGIPVKLKDSHGGDMDEWPEDLRVREFPTVRQ